MADESGKIVYEFTETGLKAIRDAVKALEDDLAASGIAVDDFSKQFKKIDKNVGKGAKQAGDEIEGVGKKSKKASEDIGKANENLAAQRYALYDIASTYAVIGAALTGVGIYAAVVGSQFESAFTNVERTLQSGTTVAEVDEIRSSLVALSGQIPLTFQELSSIATIGNQMGIAEDEIVGFTGTIARFASVSGMSIEAVTQAFGGFAAQTGLDPKYFENLGASIAKVGIDSNATETQIVSLMREISAGAAGAGFTADQIVGLAGSLASLQIAPERARGSLDTYFGTLNRAVAAGGEELAQFATIVGVTAEELDAMVRSGQGADIMRGFLEGLNDLDNVQVTQALDGLGLAQLRVSNTFKRLSADLSIFDRDQENAKTAFIEGAELARQYAMTVDDLASQWTIFINGLNAVVDAISGGAIPTIAGLFAVINNVLFALTEWLGNNQWAGMAIAFGVAVTTIIGVMFLFRAATVGATASVLALRLVIQQTGATSIGAIGSLGALRNVMTGVGVGAVQGAAGVNVLRGSIARLLGATGIGLLLTVIGSLGAELLLGATNADNAALSLAEYNDAVKLTDRGMGDGAESADNFADSLGGAGGAAADAAVKVRTLADYASDLAGVFGRSTEIRFGSADAMDNITSKWIELNKEVEEYQRKIRGLTADRELKAYWLGIAETYDDQIRAAQLRSQIADIDDELAKAQEGASRELEGNSEAAIRNRRAMRGLLGDYDTYVKSLAAAGYSQEEIQAIISTLNVDFQNQAESLGYGAAQLQTYTARFGDLATIIAAIPPNITVAFNADPALLALNEFFAKAQESATNAGGAAGGGFGSGFNDGLGAAFADDTYQRGIGKSVGDQMFAGFEDFFTNTEAGRWFAAMIPPSVVEFIGTLFKDDGRSIADKWFSGWGQMFAGLRGEDWRRIIWPGSVLIEIIGAFAIMGAQAAVSFASDFIANIARALSASTIQAAIGGFGSGKKVSVAYGYADGGYTGPGGKYQPAGVVHRGEYVIPKAHVDQRTGLPSLDYVQSLQRSRPALQPKASYATGGFVGGGSGGMMELGPMSLNYLGNALRVSIGVDGRNLASATSGGDRALALAGSN